ncbi:MAG: response regulator transcription factor, partial [Solirubrobacterales bacterium]|nr:response regulator transcription factor [Solirubrobacterales bacterium]
MRLLIADNPATRMGIRMALGGTVEVCAEADDAESAIRAAKREQPEACLLAREIAGDWVGAVRGICRAAPNAAVVVLAQVQDADDLLKSVRAGAVGYVPGALDPAALRRIIAAVAAQEAVVPRSLAMELVLELRAGGAGGSG